MIKSGILILGGGTLSMICGIYVGSQLDNLGKLADKLIFLTVALILGGVIAVFFGLFRLIMGLVTRH